jgi:eukaryotic-like serine/threonine-protein kinase
MIRLYTWKAINIKYTTMTEEQTPQSNLGNRISAYLNTNFPYGTLRRKLTLWLGVPAIVLLFGLGLLDKCIMPSVTRLGEDYPIPDFTNRRLIEAEIQLEELGLTYKIASQEYAPGKEQGVILQQFPPTGTRVKSGREVKLIISLGQKMIEIPIVAGKSVRQAMLDLETSGLTLGEIAWAFSDTLPEKVVVFSYPAAGTEIPLGSRVNLMVNRGRASNYTFMPDITGLTLEDARHRLEEKSLRVGKISRRKDDDYLPDTVLEQSELEGTEVEVGTTIDLIVSTT